jgi:hypothetical protein
MNVAIAKAHAVLNKDRFFILCNPPVYLFTIYLRPDISVNFPQFYRIHHLPFCCVLTHPALFLPAIGRDARARGRQQQRRRAVRHIHVFVLFKVPQTYLARTVGLTICRSLLQTPYPRKILLALLYHWDVTER